MAKKKMNVPLVAGIIIVIIILAAAAILLWGKPTGYATTPVGLTGTIAATVTCAASPSSVSFPAITLGSDATTTTGTIIDMTGSNANTKVTATASGATWIYTSKSTSYGISCPTATGTAASTLNDGVGYKAQEMAGANDCRNGAGIAGATVGTGTGSIPTLQQCATTMKIFWKVKALLGTAPGTYTDTVTFTCAQTTPATSAEISTIEYGTNTAKVKADGVTDNIYVLQSASGAAPMVFSDTLKPSITICDSVGKCVQPSATDIAPSIASPCANLYPTPNTPHGLDIIWGRFKTPAGLTPGVGGYVLIETPPSTAPAPGGVVAQAQYKVTIDP